MITSSQNIILVNNKTAIPLAEISFTFSRSSKPGGQNVNKVNTRATLWFNIAKSPSLTSDQKILLFNSMPSRINKSGTLWIVSYKFRTQGQNKKATIDRFISLLDEAFHIQKPRKKTRTPYSVHRKRLSSKKSRGKLKQTRKKGSYED